MNVANLSLYAAAIFFAIYGVACAIESGVAINMLTDKKMASRQFFTPLWEVTNVFLIFGVTALAMLFNNALQTLSQVLLSTMIVGLTALIVRACLVLVIFYWRDDKLPRWLAWAFTVACFTIPLSFTAGGAYLFTGDYFWTSFTGWTLMASAFLGIVAIGLTTMNRQRESSFFPNELFFAAWMIVLGSILPLAAKITLPHIQKTPMIILSLLGIAGLGVALAAINNPKFKLWRYAVLVGFLAPLLLLWSMQPYLINGKTYAADAFSAQSYAGAFLVGTAIILPLIMLGFILFWKLLKTPETKSSPAGR